MNIQYQFPVYSTSNLSSIYCLHPLTCPSFLVPFFEYFFLDILPLIAMPFMSRRTIALFGWEEEEVDRYALFPLSILKYPSISWEQTMSRTIARPLFPSLKQISRQVINSHNESRLFLFISHFERYFPKFHENLTTLARELVWTPWVYPWHSE